jgi:hypothetical protein
VEGQISFVARIVRRIMFYDLPSWVFLACYVCFAIMVGVTFRLVAPVRRLPRRKASP